MLPYLVERPSDLIDDIEGLQSEDIKLMEQALSSAKEENLLQARDIFQDLAKRYPSNPNVLFNAGLAEQATGNFGKAKEYYNQSINLPEFPEDASDYLAEADEAISKGFSTVKKI